MVSQNCDFITNTLNKIKKRKKNAKCICSYDFTTLYTKFLRKRLPDVFFQLIDFVFQDDNKVFIDVNAKGNAFWSNKLH